MTTKFLLLRNQKSGSWKYKEIDPREVKEKSWMGYEYYGLHASVAAAMTHAKAIQNDDEMHLGEVKARDHHIAD